MFDLFSEVLWQVIGSLVLSTIVVSLYVIVDYIGNKLGKFLNNGLTKLLKFSTL